MNAYTVADKLCEASVGPTQGQLDDIMRIIEEVMNEHADMDDFEQVANKRMAEEGYPIRFDRRDELLNHNHAPGRVGEDAMVLMPPHIFSLDMLRHVISHEGVHVFQMAAAERKGKAAEMFKSAHDRMMLPGGGYDKNAYFTDKHEVMAHARSLIDKYRAQRMSKRQALQQLRTDPSAGRIHREQRQRFLKNAYNYAQELPESEHSEEINIGNGFRLSIDQNSMVLHNRFGKPCGALYWRQHSAGGKVIELEHMEVDQPNRGLGEIMLREFVKAVRQQYPSASHVRSSATSMGIVRLLRRVFGPEVKNTDLFKLPDLAPDDWVYARNASTVKYRLPKVQETADPDDVNPLDYAIGSIDPLFVQLSEIGFVYDGDDRMSLNLGGYSRVVHVYAPCIGSSKYIGELWFITPTHQSKLVTVRRTRPAVMLRIVNQWIKTYAYKAIAEAQDPDEFDPQEYLDSTPLHGFGRPSLDEFTTAYAICALWSTHDNSDPNTGGEPMDQNYSISDIEDATLWQMVDDCKKFRETYAELLAQSGLADEQAGHDFWLSRNGHGSGFFDEGTEVDDELQAAAKTFDEVNLEVSDEGTVYAM